MQKVSRKPTQGGKKLTGLFPSAKMGVMIPWESQLERDWLYLLEHDSEVTSINAQPEKIHLIFDSKRRRYTPDFRVLRNGKVEIHEVKPFEKTKSEENRKLFRAAKAHYLELEIDFRIVDEEEIQREPRLENTKILFRYSAIPCDMEIQISCLKFFKDRATATIRELATALSTDGVNRIGTVYSLVYHSFLKTDLEKPLTQDSPVTYTGKMTTAAKGVLSCR